MELLTIILVLFALPLFLAVILTVIFFHLLGAILPAIGLAMASTLFIIFSLGIVSLPFRTIIIHPKTEKYSKVMTLILFSPLLILLFGTLIAFPFVMLFSLTDNPILWISIIVFIILANLIYHNRHKIFN